MIFSNVQPNDIFRDEAMFQKGRKEGYDKGFHEGYAAGGHQMVKCVKTVYRGAICIVLHDQLGMDVDQIVNVLNAIEAIDGNTFTSLEVAEQAWEKLGLWIDENEPMPEFRKEEEA